MAATTSKKNESCKIELHVWKSFKERVKKIVQDYLFKEEIVFQIFEDECQEWAVIFYVINPISYLQYSLLKRFIEKILSKVCSTKKVTMLNFVPTYQNCKDDQDTIIFMQDQKEYFDPSPQWIINENERVYTKSLRDFGPSPLSYGLYFDASMPEIYLSRQLDAAKLEYLPGNISATSKKVAKSIMEDLKCWMHALLNTGLIQIADQRAVDKINGYLHILGEKKTSKDTSSYQYWWLTLKAAALSMMAPCDNSSLLRQMGGIVYFETFHDRKPNGLFEYNPKLTDRDLIFERESESKIKTTPASIWNYCSTGRGVLQMDLLSWSMMRRLLDHYLTLKCVIQQDEKLLLEKFTFDNIFNELIDGTNIIKINGRYIYHEDRKRRRFKEDFIAKKRQKIYTTTEDEDEEDDDDLPDLESPQ